MLLAGARPYLRLLALTAGIVLVATGCAGKPAPAGSPSPAASRPSSPARITIVSPGAGAVVEGGTIDVKVELQGARILAETTTKLKPDEGHIHLTLDGETQTMAYGLEETLQVTPGNHLIQAEFVAGDHAPFSPRIIAVKSFQAR